MFEGVESTESTLSLVVDIDEVEVLKTKATTDIVTSMESLQSQNRVQERLNPSLLRDLVILFITRPVVPVEEEERPAKALVAVEDVLVTLKKMDFKGQTEVFKTRLGVGLH